MPTSTQNRLVGRMRASPITFSPVVRTLSWDAETAVQVLPVADEEKGTPVEILTPQVNALVCGLWSDSCSFFGPMHIKLVN